MNKDTYGESHGHELTSSSLTCSHRTTLRVNNNVLSTKMTRFFSGGIALLEFKP